MRWLWVSILALVGTGCTTRAQLPPVASPPAPVGTEIPIPARLFTTDQLRQLYVVTPTNALLKLDPALNELFQYTNNRLGDLALIDVSNPFSVLLYYPDSNEVITLDRTLNERGRLNLLALGLVQVRAIGLSLDNQVWVYDELNNQLKKLSTTGEVTLASDDLSLLLGQNISPNFLTARNRRVYLNDPGVGVLVFDLFGQYLKTIDLKGLAEFQILGDQLLYTEAGQLRSFQLQSLLFQPVQLPPGVTVGQRAEVQKGYLYDLMGERVRVVRLE